jgi:methyl-accepting chemotaxis protein
MKLDMNLRKHILLGYLTPLLLMLAILVAVVWNARGALDLSRSLEQTHAIINNIKDAHLASAVMQRAARGYLIVHNDPSLREYGNARAMLRAKLQALAAQISDPVQRRKIADTSAASESLIDVIDKAVQLVGAGDTAQAVQLFVGGSGIEAARVLDARIAEFDARESDLLEARQAQQTASIEALVNVVLVTTALAVVLALALGWWAVARIGGSIGVAIAGMGSFSNEIAATIAQHERTVTQQALAVAQTSSTVEELGASSRQSAAQAEAMASAARQSVDVTEQGIGLANQVSSGMADMQKKVGSVAEQILRLSEQAGQIGGIATVVGELAGESNMLALNAAVEAARAGEHGKGFAVVAAEVRKLAEQSKKSAERTNLLVVDIQKAINSAVMVTEESSRTAEKVAQIIDQTIAAFGSISASANGLAVSAQQVVLNSQQQAAALGQVTEAMRSLTAGSAEMAAGTSLTKAGVQKINSVALGLKAMV